MPQIRETAGTLLRHWHNSSQVRWLGRHLVRGIPVYEASPGDLLAVQCWLSTDGDVVEPIVQNETVTNWVAHLFGQPAGFVQLVRRSSEPGSRREHWLYGLIVKIRYRGLGIGESLCRAVITRARTEGADYISLYVLENNYRAIGLYRKLGFAYFSDSVMAPDKEKGWKTGEFERVLMRKDLGKP